MKLKGVTWQGGPRDELREWLEAHGLKIEQTRSVTLYGDGSVDVIEYVLNASGKRYMMTDTSPVPVGEVRRSRMGVAVQAAMVRADEMRIPFPYDAESL